MRIDFPGVVGTIDVYLDVMRAICGDTKGKSMIDLGCCFAPNTPKLGFSKRKYIDVIDRKLDHPEEQQFFRKHDITKLLPLICDIEDVAIASDVIEHLTKPDGYKLLRMMRSISRKQILFTPTDEIFKMVGDDNKDPEAHRSLWTPDDVPEWFASIVFPDYHKVWNGGAFFFFHCGSMLETVQEFERVKDELKQKPWANQ